MSRRRELFPAPYVLWALDGALANYAGVSPDEAIGEPSMPSWAVLIGALEKGYDVVVLTWRESGLVWAWMGRGKLERHVNGHPGQFRIENSMPAGRPMIWVTDLGPLELGEVAALPDRKRPS